MGACKYQALVSGNVRINGKVYHPTIAEKKGCPNFVIAAAVFHHFIAVMGMGQIFTTRTGKRKRLKWSRWAVKQERI